MMKMSRIGLMLCIVGAALTLGLQALVSHQAHVLGRTLSRVNQIRTTGAIQGQSSTLLPDGRVLLLGGLGSSGLIASGAIEDSSGVITPLRTRLLEARAWHTASILPDGKVFIFGGVGKKGVMSDGEVFDPATQLFRPISVATLRPRAHHTATVLTDGNLLIAGGIGADSRLADRAQLWTPSTNISADLNSFIVPRRDDVANLLTDGTVLFWGGIEQGGQAIPDGEVFDPVANSFRLETSHPAREENFSMWASIPQDGAENVPVRSLISIRFSRPAKVQSVSATTVQMSGPGGRVSARVVPAESGMLVFLTPGSQLLPGTTYTVTLSGITDLEGATLDGETLSFKTAGDPNDNSDNFDNWSGGPENSPWRKLAPLKARPGVTAISGQVLLLSGHPLAHVTLKAGNGRTETDHTGRFLLQNVPAGHVKMVIDGRSANLHGATYGVFVAGVDVTARQTNVLNYTSWMPQLDMAHGVKIPVPTRSEVVVKTPYIPGLEFHLPARTTIKDIDGKTVDQVSITPIPIRQPPFPLPPGVNTPIYFTIQPGGGWIYAEESGDDEPDGGWLVYPNFFHEPAGSTFDFWNYDADQKGWFVYGQGKVSANGNSIIPNPDVEIYTLSGAMAAGSGEGPSSGSGPNSPAAGEPVDLATGLFNYQRTDFYLPDVIPIQLTRSYRPNDGASRAFGVGTSHTYDMFLVCGCYSYLDLVLPTGGRIHFPRISAGTSFSDAVFQANATFGPFFGAKIAWNGNGWTLTRRDGTIYAFPDGYLANRPQQSALLSITDRNGNVLRILRDSNSNITQITSPNGRWIQFTYDSNYRVTQVQDNIGRTVQYFYDSGGRLNKVIDADGGTWLYNYDSNNNMTSLVDARNITYLQNQYDGSNRVTKQILADGVNTYQFAYNQSSCSTNCSGIWETDVTDPNGNVEKVLFNAAPLFPSGYVTGGTVASVTYAAGTPLAATYRYQYRPGTDLVTNITDPLSRTTSFAYDNYGNAMSVTKLSGTSDSITYSFTYDPRFNQLTSITDPLGHTTSLMYDSQGNCTSVVDPTGVSTSASYNSAGQPVTVVDSGGNTFQLTYNGADLGSISDSLGRSVGFSTDAAGRRLSYADPMGNRTQFSWTPLDRLATVTDPLNNITTFTWDPNGNLLSVTDANQHVTSYTYDNMDRLATRTDALQAQERYVYDGNSNLTQFSDRNGIVTSFQYDELNRLAFLGSGALPGSTYQRTTSFTYDGGNRLINVADSLSGTITNNIDELDRLTSQTTAQGSTGYQYDMAGRRTSMTVSGQPSVNYSYDNSGRLTQAVQAANAVNIGYDSAGRRFSLVLPNNVSVAYSYNIASQLIGITYQNAAGQLGNLTYVYDLAGRPVKKTGSFASTSLPSAVSSAQYDADNRLTRWAGVGFTYDSEGNMLSDGINTYSWDARNQLAMVSGATNASFQYDALGRRISKTIGSVTTAFLYDGMNVAQEQSSGSETNLLSGETDEVFTRNGVTAENFLLDAEGSTIATTDSSGNLLTEYSYDPFGDTILNGGVSTNPYQYSGRENDEVAGLYYYRARYYKPQIGRFVSQDPIGFRAGMNVYAYVADSPTAFVDPFGLDRRGIGPGSGWPAGNGPNSPGGPNEGNDPTGPNKPDHDRSKPNNPSQNPPCLDPATAQKQAAEGVEDYVLSLGELAGTGNLKKWRGPGVPGGPVSVPTELPKPGEWPDYVNPGIDWYGAYSFLHDGREAYNSAKGMSNSIGNAIGNALNCSQQ